MATKPRSIFEEVDSTQKHVATPGGIDRGGNDGRGAMRVWLMTLFALVALMIAVGGLTRLTDSGLSITEWKPLTGALPPLSAEAWDVEFDKYRAIPEYQLQNKGMTLSEFKTIYWWEWGHRQLGRVIGLVWALGFAYFLIRRQVPSGWTGRLVFIGALGGLQGAIGWWMVSSGLQTGMLDVASYRLAVHLGLAFVILGFIAWYVLRLSRRSADLLQARRSGDAGLWTLTTWFMAAVFVQIILGALVAGIDAGRAYPDWPLMAGGIFPPDPFGLTPIWRNFFEDAGLVQFIHRTVGYGVFLLGIFVWWRGRRIANLRTRFALNAMFAMLFLQMVLGVVTVLYSAPAHIAILHQIGAVVLWVLVLRARFLSRYPHPQSVRGTQA